MAITYAYPTVTPELQDLLVGTEMAVQGGEDTPRTRTFTIASIVDLVETGITPTLQQVTTAGSTTTSQVNFNRLEGEAIVVTGGLTDLGLITVGSSNNASAIYATCASGSAIYAKSLLDGAAIYVEATAMSAGVIIGGGGLVIAGTNSPSTGYQLSLTENSAAKPSTNTWTIASDSRVKTNISPYTKGLETILAINPITYDYNGKAGFDTANTGNIGIIAQDVLNIIPESINTYYAKLNEEDEEKTELYNFDSHALTFILINAIKQLNAEIELLKSK